MLSYAKRKYRMNEEDIKSTYCSNSILINDNDYAQSNVEREKRFSLTIINVGVAIRTLLIGLIHKNYQRQSITNT